jgi:hypothetical protein
MPGYVTALPWLRRGERIARPGIRSKKQSQTPGLRTLLCEAATQGEAELMIADLPAIRRCAKRSQI